MHPYRISLLQVTKTVEKKSSGEASAIADLLIDLTQADLFTPRTNGRQHINETAGNKSSG